MAQVVDTAGKQTVVTPSVTRSHGGGNAGYNPGEDNQLSPSFEGSGIDEGKVRKLWSQNALSGSRQPSRSVASGGASGLNAVNGRQHMSPSSSGYSLPDDSYWDMFQRYASDIGNNSGHEGNDDASGNGRQALPEVSPFFESLTPQASDATFVPDHLLGAERTNDIYERDMLDNGLSEDYINSVLREPNTIGAALDQTNGLSREWRTDLMDGLTTAIDDGTMDRQHLLADQMSGKQYYHYVHDLGLPGMPEDEIDIGKNAAYSKSEQQRLYGFQPYVPNSTYLVSRNMVPDVMADARMLKDHVSNIRSRGLFNNADYGISADTGAYGYQTFSGRDFDRKMPGYFSQANEFYEAARDGDPDALSRMINDPGDGLYTTMVNQLELPDGSHHYGVITDIEPSRYDTDMQSLVNNGTIRYDKDGAPTSLVTEDGFSLNISPTSDGYYDIDMDDEAFREWNDSHLLCLVGFSDGSSLEMPASDLDYVNDRDNWSWVQYEGSGLDVEPRSLTVGTPTSFSDTYDPVSKSGSAVGAYFSPDMVLTDGTRIPYDVARVIANDSDPRDTDDGISYSFEKSGLDPLRYLLPMAGPVGSVLDVATHPLTMLTDSRPRRLMSQVPIDEEGFHVRDFPNNLEDWSANSMTISLPYLQWVNAFADAMPYYSGVSGQSRSETGRYGLTGYDPDDPRNTLLSIPVLAGPALENLAGNVGHETWLDKPMTSLIDRRLARGTLPNVLAHHGFDMFGEGIEENFGDIVDELGTYGKDAYANPASFPPDGVDVYDDDGRLLRSADDLMTYGPWPAMYDEYGRQFKDPDTPLSDRVSNFVPHTSDQLVDAANSFIGGAGVSALMGFPSLVGEGIASHMQTERGDWGSPSYASHMGMLGRDFPYAGKSLSYARNDMRRKIGESAGLPDVDPKVPESLLSPQKRDRGSDIIRYKPGKYAIPDDAPLPELK